jgi:hypothetical protein
MRTCFKSNGEWIGGSAQKNIGSGQAHNQDHPPATSGTGPERGDRLGGAPVRGRGGLRGRSEQVETKRQKSGSPPMGKKAKVSDAHKTLWQQVKQKTTQELICGECHRSLSVAVRAVSPEECDVVIRKGDQAMVGNGHSMGIAAEIAENIFRSAEGPFAVDDPLMVELLTDKGVERLRVREMLKLAVEVDLAFCESVLQSCPEFASKDAPEHFFGKEEAMARLYPALVIEGESAGGSDTMHMGMMFHLLTPGMEHAEEADLSAKTFGIASDLDQRFCAGAEQQTVDEFLVLQCQGCQETRHRKDDVSVGRGQELLATLLDPAQSGVGLALGAVPVATRIIGDGLIITAGTLIQMPAESGRAATGDSSQDLQVLAGEPMAAAFDEPLPRCADDIGHLQRWSAHL